MAKTKRFILILLALIFFTSILMCIYHEETVYRWLWYSFSETLSFNRFRTDIALKIDLEPHNLPQQYFARKHIKTFKKLGNHRPCNRFPYIFNIKFNNYYWQVLERGDEKFYLFSAYLDVRPGNRDNPSLRILSMRWNCDNSMLMWW